METFACGYCGASQIVERHGGTVSLKLVNDAIQKVQQGTDKTAAELAIKRLTKDLNDVGQALQNNRIQRFRSIDSNWKIWLGVWVVGLFFCMIIGVQGTAGAIFAFILLIAGTGAVGYFGFIRYSQLNATFDERVKLLTQESNSIRKKIDRNKIIVDG